MPIPPRPQSQQAAVCSKRARHVKECSRSVHAHHAREPKHQRRVEQRAIKTEDTGGDLLTVQAGLRAGEQLVDDPPATLKDGDPVHEKAE